MKNSATEIMLQKVEETRNRARSAERSFDYANASIQRKASSSIDLFGGSATNRVVEIASDARRACDALYSAYQTEVKTLDDACRPLLDKHPTLEAVREVYNMIKWLNDESEIENNFSASLNYHSLGNVASAKYVPTMSNKLIQSFWQTKYDSWPGRAEEVKAEQERRKKQAELARLRREKEEERRKAEEAAKKLEEEKKQLALIKKAAAKKDEIPAIIDDIEFEFSKAENIRREDIENQRKRIRRLEIEFESLGFFKTREKQALRQQNETLKKELEDMLERQCKAQEKHAKDIQQLKDHMDRLSKEFKDEKHFKLSSHDTDKLKKWLKDIEKIQKRGVSHQ